MFYLQIFSTVILLAWIVSVPVRLLVIASLLRRRLASRYPVLVTWLLLSALESAVMIYIWRVHGVHAYASATRGHWKEVAAYVAYSALALESFAQWLRHFRRIGRSVVFLFVIFSMVTVLVGFAMASIIEPRSVAAIEWIRERYALFCLVFTGLWTAVFYEMFNTRLRQNAYRYAAAAALVFMGQAMGTALYAIRPAPGRFIACFAQVAIQAFPYCGYYIWMVMDGAGERYTPPPPASDADRAWLAQAERSARSLLWDLLRRP